LTVIKTEGGEVGVIAKRTTKKRMQPRAFTSSLPFDEVEEIFKATADETEPLKGILSKGQTTVHAVEDGVQLVKWCRTLVKGTELIVSPFPDWQVALTSSPNGFTTTICRARTLSDSIENYGRYEKFHARFLTRVAAADPTAVEVTSG